MKKIEGKGILSLLFFCICFCGCEKDGLQEKTRQLYIQLSMPESIHVETKAGESDPTPVLGGVEVQNVWIVQFKVNDDDNKRAGCTYIELAGIYKYDPSHTDGVKVKYTFYLGGNFTNDYNIARDYSYDITFRIAGPNSADVRVEITDGNVAIFDEVDVIKNIIVDF